MARKVRVPALLVVLVAASGGAIATASGGDRSETASPAATPERAAEVAKKKPTRFELADLFIEFNATDRDAGLQMNLDGEDWTRLKLRDPKGEVLMDVTGRRELRDNGLTELFFESAEPPLEEVPFNRFQKRFPEGKYTFRGRTVEGRRLVASDRLSHLVPDGPNVTFPTEGARVDPNGFTVTWDRVTRPAGVDIARYIVIVTQEPGERELSIELPPSATSAGVPGQFLQPDTKTEVEVLAREKSGNQTITQVGFRTR
jgi:hypothetical protein